tara:strand:+ start:23826 stop:25202 length:1377 start_codon:yes stop_codon:yes gene_type:complete
MSAAGTPIRLVQESGRRIELMATDIQITTTRKVGQMALGNTGSKRFGMDRNKNNCAIVVAGIITDDREDSAVQGPTCYIDWGDASAMMAVGDSLFRKDSTTGIADFRENFDKQLIIIKNADETEFVIRLLDDGTGTDKAVVTTLSVTNHSTGGSANLDIIDIRMQNLVNGTSTSKNLTDINNWKDDFIDQIVAAINNSGLTLDNGYSGTTTISAHFTAVKTKSAKAQNEDWRIEITADSTAEILGATPAVGATGRNKIKGSDGVTYKIPGPSQYKNTSRRWTPTVGRFNNREIGYMSGKRSAGDKVQDLVGILNNSDNMGLMGFFREIGAGIMKGISLLLPDGMDSNGNRPGVAMDYIMAIEIPFKSFVNATSGQESDVRVFHMPTGNTIRPGQKGADVALQPGDKTTNREGKWSGRGNDQDQNIGIDGAVQSFDVNYAGGETVYNFTLTFLPIDWLF